MTLADVGQLRDGTTDVVYKTAEKISHLGLANSSAVKHPAGTVMLSRTASVGFSSIMGVDMATSQDFATWTCSDKLVPRFLLHALRAMAPEFRRLAAGSTHKTIYMPDIEQLRIPLPPLDQQRRIVDFLDVETTRIDHLRALRRRQADLLSEHQVAFILDSLRGRTVPGNRKESGLSWLGDVPESWPIAPVSAHFEVLLGKMLNQDRVQGDFLKPYLRNTNVQWDRVDTEDLLLMDFPPAEQRRYRLHAGDLLVCEGGEPGRAAIWEGQIDEIYYQKALHRVRARGASEPRWLFYCLRAATAMNVFAMEGNQTTIAHLTGEQLRAHRFPFPDPRIQKPIVVSLDESEARVRTLRAAIAAQEGCLTERRQALITGAVTGQFDVSTASGADLS